MDVFEVRKNSKKIQFTVIVQCTKLNVIIESKNRNKFLMNITREAVHCFLPSDIWVILDEDMRYSILDNTSRN